jgi:hypothetical protein
VRATPDTGNPSGVQCRGMRAVARRAWPHWQALRVNTCELTDPAETRHVRVVLFERLDPGEQTQLAPAYIPGHRNSYDVLSVNVNLPLQGSGADLVEPLGGEVGYRPEGLYSQAMPGPNPRPPEGHVQVNIYLHATGPSGARMVTLDEIAGAIAGLDVDRLSRMRLVEGEYVEADGTVREALEVCWEEIMGRPITYPDPPCVSAPVIFPITATPWTDAPDRPGVEVKRFAGLKHTGVSMELLRLGDGARLPAQALVGSRFVAVLAGRIRFDGACVHDLSVMFGGPGQVFGELEAEANSLLWMVNWQEPGHVD